MNKKKTSAAAIVAIIASFCPFAGIGLIMAFQFQPMPPAWIHYTAGGLVVFGSLAGLISSILSAICISESKTTRKGWIVTSIAFILSCLGAWLIFVFPWGGYD